MYIDWRCFLTLFTAPAHFDFIYKWCRKLNSAPFDSCCLLMLLQGVRFHPSNQSITISPYVHCRYGLNSSVYISYQKYHTPVTPYEYPGKNSIQLKLKRAPFVLIDKFCCSFFFKTKKKTKMLTRFSMCNIPFCTYSLIFQGTLSKHKRPLNVYHFNKLKQHASWCCYIFFFVTSKLNSLTGQGNFLQKRLHIHSF